MQVKYRKNYLNLGLWLVKTSSKYNGYVLNIFKHRFFIGKKEEAINHE